MGTAQVRAAREGRSELALAVAAHVKVLAATRRGPLGLHAWTDRVEGAVAGLLEAADPDGTTTLRRGERWYVGKPVLVTANDPVLRVANGDVGVVVARPPDGPAGGASPAPPAAGAVRAVAAHLDGGLRHLVAARLDRVEPWWAMTIHKSQGSEFPHVVVSLPPATSRILTRELLYTAVTRARRSVTVIGSEAAIRAAVDRPVGRASGLRERLVAPPR